MYTVRYTNLEHKINVYVCFFFFFFFFISFHLKLRGSYSIYVAMSFTNVKEYGIMYTVRYSKLKFE